MSQKYVKEFMEKNINLDVDRYIKIIKTYKNTKELLEKSGNFAKISKQGSVATKTSIRPKNPEHEYDLDVAVQINNNNFISKKNELEIILKNEFGNRVFRKNKCVNVVWNKEFNADYVIMQNLNNHQSIFDESKNKEIKSDNLNLIKNINDVFSKSTSDALRDTSKLIKFYLRQHKEVSGLIPSIVQNLLICVNAGSKDLGYMGQMTTTISNIIYFLNNLKNSGTILNTYINPSNSSIINLNIKTLIDMQNISLVLQDLKIDIMKLSLRVLNINSEIRSKNLGSAVTEKPWKI